MPDFHCELYRLLAADASNCRATFVIKQKELLLGVNIGRFDWNGYRDHCKLDSKSLCPSQAHYSQRLALISRDNGILFFSLGLIVHYRKLIFISIPITMILSKCTGLRLVTVLCICVFEAWNGRLTLHDKTAIDKLLLNFWVYKVKSFLLNTAHVLFYEVDHLIVSSSSIFQGIFGLLTLYSK